MNRDDALAIVDSLYASALGEVDWTVTLERLADAVGSNAATVELHDTTSGQLMNIVASRLDPALNDVYAREFVWRSPRVDFLRRSMATIAYDELFISEEQMDRDAFYQEFLAPMDSRYFTAVQTPAFDDRVRGAIVTLRNGRVRGYSRESVDAMRLLHPHITRALRLYWHRIRGKVDPEYFDRLLAGFGLTPAERRLAAALMLGESLPAHARRTRRSMNTVYMHYRRIKAKLDCASQAELLARLHALNARSMLS